MFYDSGQEELKLVREKIELQSKEMKSLSNKLTESISQVAILAKERKLHNAQMTEFQEQIEVLQLKNEENVKHIKGIEQANEFMDTALKHANEENASYKEQVIKLEALKYEIERKLTS